MVLQPPLMCGTSEHSWLKPSLWGISPMYLLRWDLQNWLRAGQSTCPGQGITPRTLLSCWPRATALAQSHCWESTQGSAFHQHLPEEMSLPDFLDRELNSPAPPNQVLEFYFLKKTQQNTKKTKKPPLCYTKTTYLSQEIMRATFQPA